MGKYINLNKINLHDNPYYISSKDNENYKIDKVVERVESGVVGTLYVNNKINYPFFKTGDLVNFCQHSKLEKGNFILYSEEDKYFVRRIIKFKNEYIYVAGDNEKIYHVLSKQNIIGKAISRQRKNKNLSLNYKSKNFIYRFIKVNLAYFRLKNRVIEYQQELLDESIELAKKNTQIINQTKRVDNSDINKKIKVDLSNFIDPNSYSEDYMNGLL